MKRQTDEKRSQSREAVIIARLIALGRQQGYVTYRDILRLTGEDEPDANDFDDILAALLSMSIPYSEDGTTEAADEDPFSKAEDDDPSPPVRRPSNGRSHGDTDDLVGLYFSEAARFPLLTKDEEYELFLRIERGREAMEALTRLNGASPEKRAALQTQVKESWQARERVIRSNSRLVISLAKRYIGRGVPFLDLIQEGNIGLMRAIKKFDCHRGLKFSTYATWWVRQAVSRAVADQGRIIRIPSHMLDKLTRLFRIQREMEQSLERPPTIEELAHKLDTSPNKIERMFKFSRYPYSLEQPVGEEEADTMLGDMIENQNAPDPVDVAGRNLLRDRLRDQLDTLPPREARVLKLRYGLTDGKAYTLREVGDKMGVTRERIRQLEAQALRRLRQTALLHRLRHDLNRG